MGLFPSFQPFERGEEIAILWFQFRRRSGCFVEIDGVALLVNSANEGEASGRYHHVSLNVLVAADHQVIEDADFGLSLRRRLLPQQHPIGVGAENELRPLRLARELERQGAVRQHMLETLFHIRIGCDAFAWFCHTVFSFWQLGKLALGNSEGFCFCASSRTVRLEVDFFLDGCWPLMLDDIGAKLLRHRRQRVDEVGWNFHIARHFLHLGDHIQHLAETHFLLGFDVVGVLALFIAALIHVGEVVVVEAAVRVEIQPVVFQPVIDCCVDKPAILVRVWRNCHLATSLETLAVHDAAQLLEELLGVNSCSAGVSTG